MIFSGPFLELAGKATSVALKVGDEVVAHIPVSLLKRFEQLAPEEKTAIVAAFDAANTEEKALAELEKLLENPAFKDVAQDVIAEIKAARGSNRGLTYVAENSAKSEGATAWENGAFNPRRAEGEVPALKFDNPNPRGRDVVRFDGIDPANPKILIDRKLAATTYPKQVSDILRAAEAIRQNPGYQLIIEAPTEAAKRQVEALIKKAGLPSSIAISVRIP